MSLNDLFVMFGLLFALCSIYLVALGFEIEAERARLIRKRTVKKDKPRGK